MALRRTDRRAGAAVQRLARRELLDAALGVKWGLFQVAVLTGAGALGIEFALRPFVPDWSRGAIFGSVVTSTAFAALWAMISIRGLGPTLSGADAEANTANELRSLARSGWTTYNDVVMSRGNADHVLVGPGVIVVETKWTRPTNADTPYQQKFIADACAQARRNARSVRHRVLAVPYKVRLDVHAAVVVWGGWRDRPDVATVDGVTVVRGRALADWQPSVDDRLSGEDRATVGQAMASIVAADLQRVAAEDMPMVVRHGPGVVSDGLGLGGVCLGVLLFALHGLQYAPLWWMVALAAMAGAGRLGGARLNRGSRVRACLHIASWVWVATALMLAVVLVVEMIR
jgi:hypothetical protein